MAALAVVEALKLSQADGSGFSTGLKGIRVEAFGLEFAAEALQGRSIEAVMGATEADLDAGSLKACPILGTGVRRTPIGMLHQSRLRLTSEQGQA